MDGRRNQGSRFGTRRRPARGGSYVPYGKRALDLVLATMALLLVLPVLALASVAVRFWMGSPVLFSEMRAGAGGRPFRLWKFRTMTNAVDAEGCLLPDALRLTPLGRFLRRTSIDELPELLHVVRGDMSLVGPRPLPIRYNGRYSPAQARRLDVPPGVTGLAQVRGRNTLTWHERFALDVWYVDHQSLGLDLRLILITIAVVARGSGISHPGHATMEEFSRASR